jgi:hypothetical protein
MFYSYGEKRIPLSEQDSGRLHDILELMRLAHGGLEEDRLLLQTIIRVCRHALEPIEERLRDAEVIAEGRERNARRGQITERTGEH